MANLKETPRQKMIGLMYLVLTALLALQVDNTLLNKFLWIDESLQGTVSDGQGDNQNTMSNIRESVKKRGNQNDGLAIVAKAEQVTSSTAAVVEEIEALRNELITITGGKDEDGKFVGGLETDKVMTLAIGPGDSKNGKAYHLKKTLNDYVKKINELDPTLKLAPIALDASEINIYKGTDQENKDFAQLNFQNTPMIAALAILSQMESEIINIEARALENLASAVGAREIPIDKIVAKVSPESRVVTAGTPYRAKMYIAAASSAANPEMNASVGNVSVNEDGEGVVEFLASANNYDENGLAKKVWKGDITLKTPRGDTTFYVEEEYYVARPNLSFESTAIKALYKNCGNELSLNVPAGFGSNFDPRFTANGGEILASNRRGVITAIPKARSMNITVSNNGAVIGTSKFRVKPIPKPEIVVYGRGNRELDRKNGGRMPTRIRVKAIPESDFAQFLPKDAKYRVTKWTAAIAGGAQIRGNAMSFTTENGNIRQLAERSRRGDRLVIEIQEVIRTNYKGETERIKIGSDKYFSYPITQ